MQKRESRSEICNIREKQSIPEIGSNKIYDVEVMPIIEEQKLLTNRIMYSGQISLNYIFASNGGVDTKKVSIPFNFTMDFDGITENSNINTIIEITLQDFVVAPDETIDVKIDLNFTAISGKDASISIIDEIQQDDQREVSSKYSMVIYFVKPGDTVWKIAKKFGSTIEDITRINKIEDVNNLPIGKQLFIPRYHGC